MTDRQTKYIIPGSHNLKIPTKNEFHRFAIEKLTVDDFCTEYPNGYLVNKIASSIRWTLSHVRKDQYYVDTKIETDTWILRAWF